MATYCVLHFFWRAVGGISIKYALLAVGPVVLLFRMSLLFLVILGFVVIDLIFWAYALFE